jgi:hypothetical protein
MHVTLDKSKHVWCCHFLEGGSKVSLLGFRTFPNVTSVLEFTDYWKVDPKFLGEQMTLEGALEPLHKGSLRSGQSRTDSEGQSSQRRRKVEADRAFYESAHDPHAEE